MTSAVDVRISDQDASYGSSGSLFIAFNTTLILTNPVVIVRASLLFDCLAKPTAITRTASAVVALTTVCIDNELQITGFGKNQAQSYSIQVSSFRLPPVSEFNPSLNAMLTASGGFALVQWRTATPVSASATSGVNLTILSDGSVLQNSVIIGPDSDIYSVVVNVNSLNLIAVRLDVLTDPSLPQNGPGRASNGNFVLTKITIESEQTNGSSQVLNIASASADFSQSSYPVSSAFNSRQGGGWAIEDKMGANHSAIFALSACSQQLSQIIGSTRLRIRLEQLYGAAHVIGKFRLSMGYEHRTSIAWSSAIVSASASSGVNLTILSDGAVMQNSQIPGPDTDIYTITINTRLNSRNLMFVRLDVLTDPSLPQSGPGLTPWGNFVLSKMSVVAVGLGVNGSALALKLESASADFSQDGFDVSAALDMRDGRGWAIQGGIGQNHRALFKFAQLEEADKLPENVTLRIRLEQVFGGSHVIGKFRLSLGSVHVADNAQIRSFNILMLNSTGASEMPILVGTYTLHTHHET